MAPRARGQATRPGTATDHVMRYLAGLDAERARLDIKTMALEGHEPLWSMGDDTPTPGRGRLDRPVADHLRQAFAQVTNPAIDPERERVVMDLRVELGRRPSLLGGPPRGATDRSPVAPDRHGSRRAPRRRCVPVARPWRRSTRRGTPAEGPSGLEAALDRLAAEAVAASRRGAGLVVVSDAAWSIDRLPVPSILAAGAVHTALTGAGLRGRTDVAVSAADILDVHAMAMVLAVGATAVHPRLAIELAAELAGTRGAETLTPAETVLGLVAAFEAGLRKTLARMGISAVASYIGGALIDVVDLDASVVARCFPTAAAWPGRTTLADVADRQIRRRDAALAIPEPAAVASRGSRTPGSPGSAPTARRTCSRRGSRARSRSWPGTASRRRRRARRRRRPGSLSDRRSRDPPRSAPCRATSSASGRPRRPSRWRRSRTPARSSAGSSCRR